MIAEVRVPKPVPAGRDVGLRLLIKNKLGQPVVADDVVVTIADPSGAAKGLSARGARRTRGAYYFHYTFPKPGHYTLRVFPPSVDAWLEIQVDVL
jgi:hypothetical protein